MEQINVNLNFVKMKRKYEGLLPVSSVIWMSFYQQRLISQQAVVHRLTVECGPNLSHCATDRRLEIIFNKNFSCTLIGAFGSLKTLDTVHFMI